MVGCAVLVLVVLAWGASGSADGKEEVKEGWYKGFEDVKNWAWQRPGGTGLGLAIAQSIADAHGGRLSFGNREGGGLGAILILPGGERP